MYLTQYTSNILKVNKKKFCIKSIYHRFHQRHIITCGSKLCPEDKDVLKKNLANIGGKYVENWESSCTHVTTRSFSATKKVLLALLAQIPIVPIDFWISFSEKVSKNLLPPDTTNYSNLTIDDPLLKNIKVNVNIPRTSLFEGKHFIFPNDRTKEQVQYIIRKAGMN